APECPRPPPPASGPRRRSVPPARSAGSRAAPPAASRPRARNHRFGSSPTTASQATATPRTALHPPPPPICTCRGTRRPRRASRRTPPGWSCSPRRGSTSSPPVASVGSPDQACRQPGRIVDLFGGGGWEEGLRELGYTAVGIDTDAWACATARAAGHERVEADIAALDPLAFAPVWGLIGSPPCQASSTAGKGLGRQDKPRVIACAHELAIGNDTRAD